MHTKILFKLLIERLRKKISDWILYPVCHLLYKLKYKHVASPEKTIEVDIRHIQAWYRGNRYDEFTFPGQIKGGDWSNKITPRDIVLDSNEKYYGLIQHFRYGMPWNETDLFRIRYKGLIEQGVNVKGFNNLDDVEAFYLKTYDKLFSSIKKRGVIAASENHSDIEPIYINIDRDGELLYTVDGNHRLYMCLILGIDKIPVRVWLRHSEWQKKRDYILSRNEKNLEPEYQKYLTHPDIITEISS